MCFNDDCVHTDLQSSILLRLKCRKTNRDTFPRKIRFTHKNIHLDIRNDVRISEVHRGFYISFAKTRDELMRTSNTKSSKQFAKPDIPGLCIVPLTRVVNLIRYPRRENRNRQSRQRICGSRDTN